MNFSLFWSDHLWFVATGAGLFALAIGSFLNVVIYRLPLMLQREWQTQCAEILHRSPVVNTDTFNIALPRSHCPSCKAVLSVWDNIPLLSYLFLRGKCAYCAIKYGGDIPL